MEEKYFTIKNYPDDIYKAVGKITEAAQDWERDFKELARLLNIPKINISKASLNVLNDALKIAHHISEKEYNDLKKVINIRNNINHDFFLSYFQNSSKNFEQTIKSIENELNSALFYIYEATDVINNKIDELNGRFIVRPTVFD